MADLSWSLCCLVALLPFLTEGGEGVYDAISEYGTTGIRIHTAYVTESEKIEDHIHERVLAECPEVTYALTDNRS